MERTAIWPRSEKETWQGRLFLPLNSGQHEGTTIEIPNPIFCGPRAQTWHMAYWLKETNSSLEHHDLFHGWHRGDSLQENWEKFSFIFLCVCLSVFLSWAKFPKRFLFNRRRQKEGRFWEEFPGLGSCKILFFLPSPFPLPPPVATRTVIPALAQAVAFYLYPVKILILQSNSGISFKSAAFWVSRLWVYI